MTRTQSLYVEDEIFDLCYFKNLDGLPSKEITLDHKRTGSPRSLARLLDTAEPKVVDGPRKIIDPKKLKATPWPLIKAHPHQHLQLDSIPRTKLKNVLMLQKVVTGSDLRFPGFQDSH